ncbi:Hypothetical predicted protein [Cloeon dipterum]|uniref:Uncharacterized protein n=1 Tax=Cloeon dipterum TaxID=197152 RepID=A0A8S1DF14_9INSE|nr:Hypothetical predicted protein [Cloeon dipterum]
MNPYSKKIINRLDPTGVYSLSDNPKSANDPKSPDRSKAISASAQNGQINGKPNKDIQQSQTSPTKTQSSPHKTGQRKSL